MKAELIGWTEHQSGTISLTDDDGKEIALMRIIGLSNVPDVSKFNHRHKAIALSVALSINGYEGELAINE